jgi:hypothetical protein
VKDEMGEGVRARIRGVAFNVSVERTMNSFETTL